MMQECENVVRHEDDRASEGSKETTTRVENKETCCTHGGVQALLHSCQGKLHSDVIETAVTSNTDVIKTTGDVTTDNDVTITGVAAATSRNGEQKADNASEQNTTNTKEVKNRRYWLIFLFLKIKCFKDKKF